MKVLAVIPARYGSRRFPGKPLQPICGTPLVARVASAVIGSGVADRVILATDDPRIARAVSDLALEVVLSDAPFRCGSDRVAAAVRGIDGGQGLDPEADAVLDVQGDEALVDREILRAALAALDGGAELGTVAAPLRPGQAEDPDVVKVTFDREGRAIDFFRRGTGDFFRRLPGDFGRGLAGADCWAHVGVYAYRPAALARFAALPTSPREASEGLEQLRAMTAGMAVGVKPARGECLAINRLEDVAALEAHLLQQATSDLRHHPSHAYKEQP